MDDNQRAEAVIFCERVRPRLVGALSLYCGDADLAEEYAHEALIRVWQHWSKVRAMQSPEAWAFRVAVNAIHSVFRRRAVERRVLARVATWADPERGGRVAQTPTGSESAHVRRAVAALPRRQREVLVLRYFLDLTVADTAEQMGCATGTVKSLTHKAIAALRDVPEIRQEQEAPR